MKFNKNFNLFTYSLIILSLLFSFWLFTKEVNAGTIFFGTFLFGILMIFLAFFFVKEEKFEGLYVPISTSYVKAITLFTLAFSVPLLLNFVGGLQTAKVMQPLSSGNLGESTSAIFSVAQIETSKFWDAAVTVILAGTIEEFVFGFAIILATMLIGMFVLKSLSIDLKKKGLISNQNFMFVIGLVFSMIYFVIMHTNNETYTNTSMFIWAGVFRTLLNIAIWKLGFLLSAAIGYHWGNNLAYWVNQNSWADLWNVLFSYQGIGVLIVFLLAAWLLVFSIVKLRSKYFKEVFGGWLEGK